MSHEAHDLLNGMIAMFCMLTLCSWTYNSKLPLKLFKVSMIATGVVAIGLSVLKVSLLILGK